MSRNGSREAFSLVELLVTIAIVAGLVVLGLEATSQAISQANRADSAARLRSMGQAIHLYAADHGQQLPGPLWPGQVMQYDPLREGRLVRDLATYLDIEQRESPYVVDRMFPKAYLRNTPGVKREDVRVYVMNTSITTESGTLMPFGSLTLSPVVPTLRLNQMGGLPADENWMMSEADQIHPDVASAPWKTSTPVQPAHRGQRALLNFDGSVRFERVPAS